MSPAPAPLPQRVCPNASCPYAAKHGAPARFRAGTPVCNDCGAPLVDDNAAAPSSPAIASSASRSSRHRVAGTVAATLALAAVFPLLDLVPLPFVVGNARAGFLDLFNRPTALLSIAALGVTPWLVGSGLVEIVAAIVPRWRPYRHDERRAKLARASVVVGIIAAFLQSTSIIRLLTMSNYGGASLEETPNAALFVAVTLVACACVAPFVVALARKHAVGNAWCVIVAGSTAVSVIGAVVGTVMRLDTDAYTPMSVVVALTCIAVPAFIAWRLVQPFDDVEHPDAASAPRPSAGIYPASFAQATPALVASIAAIVGVDAPNRGDLGSALAGAVVGVVVTFPFAYGFVRDAQSRQRAFPATIVLNAVLFCSAVLASRVSIPLTVDAVLVAQFVAIARDLALELRHRRRHGALVAIAAHWRFPTAARDLAALNDASIAAVPRGAHYRALMHFFAPLVPIEILVPAADVDRARDVLAGTRSETT